MSVPKLYFYGLEATIETLENEQVMDQLERSGIDIKNGAVGQVREFIKKNSGPVIIEDYSVSVDSANKTERF